MKRLVKNQGFGNVALEEVETPRPAPDQILVKVKRSLISAGSELHMRYVKEEAVDPDIMGYLDVGEAVEVGEMVEDFGVGDRLSASAPHAQYVLANTTKPRFGAFPIPTGVTDEQAVFIPIATSALMWANTTPINAGDTVVVLGQGLIGLLYAQLVRERNPKRVITVDLHELRCRISKDLGADEAINGTNTNAVERVRELTGGDGAEAVVECAGGTGGIKAFEQAQEMISDGGVIHLIGKYQGGPLQLYGDSFMNKVLVAGIRCPRPREEYTAEVAEKIADGSLEVTKLITHRVPWEKTPDAFHMLYERPAEALGVVLLWD